MPGSGTHYWTQRFGQYWVGGGVYQAYAGTGWECGGLGPPVKAYQWLSEFGAYGQWFEGGAIYYSGGRWKTAFGNYGQTAGRLTEDVTEGPADAERPSDAPGAEQPPVAPPLHEGSPPGGIT